MLYNNEMLPTLSLQGSPRSINILLYKLLSLRRLEYLAVDRQLNIQEISLKVQEFAEVPAAVKKGKDVRESFPELIGMEEILEDILEEKQPDFQLKSIMRILDDGTFLYLDLYIFGYIEELKSERLMLVYEDVTDSMAAHQSMVQHANENSIKLDYLATARDYIEKIECIRIVALFCEQPCSSANRSNWIADGMYKLGGHLAHRRVFFSLYQ